jgi:lysophospholipase L1-like esterase
MPSYSIVCVALLMCAVLAIAEPPATQPAQSKLVDKLQAGKKQKIVFYGTSLTAAGAWVGQVTDALNRAYPNLVTTKNVAKSGETSRYGVKHVQDVVDAAPDVVFIEFSVNDACARFNLSKEESRKNLESIIDTIQKANPDCEIILQVMNPVVGRPEGDPGYRPELPAYEQIYRDVAAARGLVLIDHGPAWKKILDQGEAEFKKLAPDGLHPGPAGAERVTTPNVLAALGVAKSSK